MSRHERSIIRGCALLGFVAAGTYALLLASMPAVAAFPGENGRIAVHEDRQLWTLRADGTHRRPITEPSFPRPHAPDLSPGGRRVVFWRFKHNRPRVPTGPSQVWMAHTRTGNERLVARRGSDPAFAPSGRRIVAAGRRSLLLTRLDGTHRRRLSVPRPPGEPAFAPDGRTIVFDTHSSFPGRDKIWAVGVDGGNLRTLFKGNEASAPDFSPDGERIVFSAHREDAFLGRRDIFVMDADGGNPHAVLETRAHEVDPVFSPDGTKIAFYRDRRGLFTMNADGTGVDRVSDRRDFAPDWGPRP